MDDVLDVRPLRHPGVRTRVEMGETTLVGPGNGGASREATLIASPGV